MYYAINVSQHGQHYFATSERSIRTEEQARAMFEHFSDLFPAADGYQIGATRYEKTGEIVFQNG